MSEGLRFLGFGLTAAFIIVSYFAFVMAILVYLRARAAAPSAMVIKFRSSCGSAHTAAVEGAGSSAGAPTGPTLSHCQRRSSSPSADIAAAQGLPPMGGGDPLSALSRGLEGRRL